MNIKIFFFKLISFIILTSVVFFALLFTAKQKEKNLREQGYEPGKINLETTQIEKLDSLIPDSLFIVRNGITCYSKDRPNLGTINSFGFRSPEFRERQQRDAVILCIGLIGDSFTFGRSAHPIDSCFADLLRDKTGLYVDNMGIPGAGLPEYLSALTWYVPRFRPELLYIILSDGDLINYVKEANTDYPFQYSTNAGAFPAYDEIGRFRFKNAFESRDYYLENYTLVNNNSMLSKWASQSAWGTQLWKKFFWNHLDTIQHGNEMPKSWWYFDKIDSICTQYHVRWNIVVIPHREHPVKNKQHFLEKNKDHFRNHDFILADLSKNDYVKGADTHTNNSGHYKIMKLIEDDIRDYTTRFGRNVDTRHCYW